MFEAQYLFTSEKDTGVAVLSPWMQRGGDKIRYTLDLIHAEVGEIEIQLLHKNTEDPGDGTTTGSSIAITSTVGRTDQEFAGGLKELVRYKFIVKSTDGSLGFVLFRMLSPVWFDSVKG